MKREILFRGKRIDNGKWVEGSLDYNSRYRTRHITVHNRPTIPSDMSVEVTTDTVGQFTGLTDKNGVKIFEGDIVFRSGHDVKSTIEWVEKYMCFAGKIDSTLYGFYQQIDMPFIEVIGNIFDTPELLTK